MLIRWISCHHPTRQLLHTCLEIKCWAWALVAAEKCDANLAGESILPELLLFTFASQEKGRSLAVVSLCTPGCQESPSSRYPGTFFVCFQGNWGTSKLSILFTFHWESGRAGNWSWLSKATLVLWPWTTLTYHKDPVRLVVIVFSELHQYIPCCKELTVLHPQLFHMCWNPIDSLSRATTFHIP